VIVSLGQFQDALTEALWAAAPLSGDTPGAKCLAALSAQPGFAVYRNTVIKGCVDALRANFPTVERLVGSDWMVAAATVYVRQSPPLQPQLIEYGADFPDFLNRFEPARAVPYLGDVARLDRLWLAAFAAAEQPRLALHRLSERPPAQLAELCLRPCAAAQWHWSVLPVFTIWRCNREGVELPESLRWQGEGALLCRQHNRVLWQHVSIGACAFLDACAAGGTLADASALSLEAEPTLDFNAMLANLFSADVFVDIDRKP